MATVSSGKSYRFQSMEADEYLNILTDGNLTNNTNVTTYGLNESDMAQVWQCESYSYGSVSGMLMRSKKNTAFVLDRYRGSSNYNNADIYTTATAEADLKDQLVEFVPRAYGYYRIKLVYYDLYLTRSSTATYGGKNVVWRAQTGNMDQLWLAHEYGPSSSASADPVSSAIKDKTFFIRNAMTGYNLNVYGTDTVANERNVNVYAKENCLAQKWGARQTTYGGKLFTKINEAYALNINRNTNNCSMYKADGSSDDDSLLEFELFTDNVTTAADKMYRIKMFRHGKYLAAESSSNGANVYWSDSMYGNTIWQFVEPEDMFPTVPQVPPEIKNQTFALKADDTNLYLNVYGSDTVVEEMNVNVYSKEDVLAQRWIPKQTEVGPKLFTKIDEDYALNIYTIDSNCTIRTSLGNDRDSVLDFESAGTLKYKIKMHNHNKYLCIYGTAESGANVVWAEGEEAATVWNFIPEEAALPDPEDAPASIVGQTFFIKNFNTGYNLNVHGTDTVADGRNVNVYAKENCLAQKWQAVNTDKGPKIISKINTAYAININEDDNDNCTMYTAEDNDRDSVLVFEPYTDQIVTAADKVYKIKLARNGKYLEAESVGSGENVIWSTTPLNPLWQFVTEEDMFPDIPTSPFVSTSIEYKTFLVQANGTNLNLNIDITDETENIKIVKVSTSEDCTSQKWFIANTINGPKLFSEFKDNYALSINTTDDNCTARETTIDDRNSLLEFEYIGFMKYRIKMYNHNKYLSVDGNLTDGVNVKWLNGVANATVWNLLPFGHIYPDKITQKLFLEKFYNTFSSTFDLGSDFLNLDISENSFLKSQTVLNDTIAKVDCTLSLYSTLTDSANYMSPVTAQYEYDEHGNISTSLSCGNELVSLSTDFDGLFIKGKSIHAVLNDMAMVFGNNEISTKITRVSPTHFKLDIYCYIYRLQDFPDKDICMSVLITFDVIFKDSNKFNIKDLNLNIPSIYVTVMTMLLFLGFIFAPGYLLENALLGYATSNIGAAIVICL